jgi:hypothetical protein
MAHSIDSIGELARLYFELAAQPPCAAVSAEKERIARDALTRDAQTPAELNDKARLLLHMIENAPAEAEERERFCASLLRDVLRLCRDGRLHPANAPAGSYGNEAAAGYYSLMLSGWH